jgi:tRNA(adenine34) deaminase
MDGRPGLFDFTEDHERFMRAALREAEAALEKGEVPVGAVIVEKGRIIGRGHNQRETLLDPTAHAEMIAITQAAAALESWRLADCTIYVTLEPCAMCAGALVLARLPRLVFGAADPKAGACGSVLDVFQERRLNHRGTVTPGVLSTECAGILQDFFRRRRDADPGPDVR